MGLTDETSLLYRINEAKTHTSSYCFVCGTTQMEGFFARWKKSVDEADCAAQLRRQIGKGPPCTFADVDETIVLEEDELALVFGAQISCGGKEWKSAILDGAPRNAEEKEELWAKLRLREAELPENNDNDNDEEEEEEEEEKKDSVQ